jgi:hypothetical protein
MRKPVLALASLALALAVFGGAAPAANAGSWTGTYSLYRPGVFSFHHTNYTCDGASVQMMLNIIRGENDHSAAVQMQYWQFGSEHNRYAAPNNGVDPDGWIAALANFGAGSYSINLASGYQLGLQDLARSMRGTGRPVGLFVEDGGHAWVMTGFRSTADPQTAAGFRVTYVQVMGPLYPKGTINGRPYDSKPGKWLTVQQLRRVFTPLKWRRAPEWNGRWVSVVPS